MGKCSGRCTLVAFCCLQLVSAARPGCRAGWGAAGRGPGACGWGVCLCLWVWGERPGWGVVWSHEADGRSLLGLARLSLCVHFSPGAPRSPSASCARVPGPLRAWGSARLARTVRAAFCWGYALWDCGSPGFGGVSEAGVWIR